MEGNPIKVLVPFSGGYDSVVLVHDLIDSGYDVYPLYINYKQRNFVAELKSVNYWIKKLRLEDNFKLISIPSLNWSKSPMFEGRSGEENYENEYIEMRNLIIYSYAISYAQSIGIRNVRVALIGPEYYEDTSPSFVKLFDALSFNTTGIEFIAPYVHMDKLMLTDYALKNVTNFDLKDVLENMFTCNYPVFNEPCGNCGGCDWIKRIKDKYY